MQQLKWLGVIALVASLTGTTVLGNGLPGKQRLPISLSLSLSSIAGKQTKTDVDLVSAPGNRLVIAIDLSANTVEIEEWNSSLTSQVDRSALLEGVQVLLGSIRVAAVVNGSKAELNCDLEHDDKDWNNDNVNDTDGDWSLAAKIKLNEITLEILGVSGKLSGVYNDPVNGSGGGQNILIKKGKLKSTGPVFTPL